MAVPVLYASSEDSGRSNRLILLGSRVGGIGTPELGSQLLRGVISSELCAQSAKICMCLL